MRVPSRSPGHQPGSRHPARPGPAAPVPRLPAAARRPPDLDAYREAVAELLVEVGALAGAAATAARQVLLDQRLHEPAIAAVLDATPQGLLGARETLLLEMARHQPDDRTSAADLTALVRIYLLSRIDLLWWRDAPLLRHRRPGRRAPRPDRPGVAAPPRTARLPLPGAAGGRMLGRGVHAVRRRLRPDATPRTAGVLFRRTRREIVALLNDLGPGVRRRRPAGHPAAVGDQPGPQRRTPVPAAPARVRRPCSPAATASAGRWTWNWPGTPGSARGTCWPRSCWPGRPPVN